MAHELTSTSPPKAPAPQTRADLDLLAVYRSRTIPEANGKWSISDRGMPLGSDRRRLEVRREHIGSTLTPFGESASDPRVLVARIARMFQRFPATARAADAQEMALAYARDLARFPLWAIDAGISAVIGPSHARNVEFAPSSPTVQAAVASALLPVLTERSDLARVLDAEVWVEPPPDERTRIKTGFSDLVAELEKACDPNGPRARRRDLVMTPDQALAALETNKGQTPPTLSPELRKQLGLNVENKEGVE